MQQLKYYFDKKLFKIEVVTTENKVMYLKVKDDKVVCLAPKNYSDSIIKKFVDDNANKFFKYISNLENRILYSINKKFIYLCGRKYKFNILIGLTDKVEIHKNSIDIYSENDDDEYIEKIIKNLLKKHTLEYIEKKQKIFEKNMGVPKHAIKVVYKNATWGTNSIQKRSISYNSKLAHFNNKAKDYLIVHELAHHIEANHSKEFWKIVEEYCPNYKQIRKELREPDSMIE